MQTKKLNYHYILFDVNLLFVTIFKSVTKNGTELNRVIYDGYDVFPQLISKTFKSIKDATNRFGTSETECYLLFDNPTTKTNIRSLISEGHYKKSREKKGIDKKLYATLDWTFELATQYDNNWRALRGESLEADDLTFPLIKSLQIDKEAKCLCVSADKDWARNIKNSVHWFNWKKVYTAASYQNDFGYDPTGTKIQVDKSIRGDDSDDIKPGLPYLPDDLLKHILQNYTDISHLLADYRLDPILKKWHDKINEHRDDLLRNFELTNFLIYTKNIENEIVKGKRNPIYLDIWYGILGIEKESWFKDFGKKQEMKSKEFKFQSYLP